MTPSSPEIQALVQQLNESKRRIDLIRTVTFELNKVLSLQDKLSNILKILHDEFFINYSMILMPGEDGQKLVVKSSYGYERNLKSVTVPIGTGIMGLAALKKIPINITGIRRKRQYLAMTSQHQPSTATLPGLSDPESQIAIPLLANNELVAVLLAESYNISVFSKEDETFLITLSQSIAVSIQNSLLFDTMESVIEKRTEELSRSNHTKDRLFSIISHDLRGPISSFHTIAQLVSHYNENGQKEKIKLLCHQIDQSVDRLNVLLDNLLNWALTQTREIQYRPEKLNLITLLNEVTDIYQEQLQLKKLTLVTDYPSSLFATADFHMITAVFRNLLSNAIKYTPRHGAITIRAYSEDQQVFVAFSDSGIGIAPDKLKHIFEPSEKRSTRGTENEKGTGLGLLVAKEFMDWNKGSISISSHQAKGTTVLISLPV